MRRAGARPLRLVALMALCAGCAATAAETPDYSNLPKWTSRAVPEARGDYRTLPDGKRAAVRYAGWTTRDFGTFRTYAYDDTRAEPPVQRATMPAGAVGDPPKGRALFLSRSKGPCVGCHLIPGADVWPAGSVGPDQSTIDPSEYVCRTWKSYVLLELGLARKWKAESSPVGTLPPFHVTFWTIASSPEPFV